MIQFTRFPFEHSLGSPQPGLGDTAPLSLQKPTRFAAAWTGGAGLCSPTGPELEQPGLSGSAPTSRGGWRCSVSPGARYTASGAEKEGSPEDFKS